jgi:hypothetical protein
VDGECVCSSRRVHQGSLYVVLVGVEVIAKASSETIRWFCQNVSILLWFNVSILSISLPHPIPLPLLFLPFFLSFDWLSLSLLPFKVRRIINTLWSISQV